MSKTKTNSVNVLRTYDQCLMYLEDIMGSKETNEDLDYIGKKIFKDRFIGVFTSDKMPLIHNNEMFIINNKSSREKGEHWLACYKWKNKLYIYDSFARKVITLSSLWKNKNNIVDANRYRDESYKEKNCGQRCIAWLICFDKWKDGIIKII